MKRRGIAAGLLFGIILGMLPVLEQHTAEAVSLSVSCENGGFAKQIGEAACTACGGNGKHRYYDVPSLPVTCVDFGFLPGDNYGLNIRRGVEWDGAIWDVYYRCYNCGDTGYDCKQYTEEVYRICTHSSGQHHSRGDTSYENASGRGRAEGYVPIRWCSHCGPKLASQGQPYETVAKWAQLHIEEEPVKTYTVTIKVSPTEGGTAGDGGIFEEGTVLSLWQTPGKGYTFTGWSGGTVTNGRHTVTKNITLTANFKEKAVITSGPSGPGPTIAPTRPPVATPKPDDPTPTPIPIPTEEPAPSELPLPPESEAYQMNTRYYTTDCGYSIGEIYEKNGPLTNTGAAGTTKSNPYTSLDCSYSIGQDSSGNTWYFVPDGTNAVYVHPAIYQGKDVNTSQVKNIRSLVFPEKLTYFGTEYTVTSIGGGTDRYHRDDSGSSGAGNTFSGYTLGKTSGSYYYNSNGSSASGGLETYQTINAHTGYRYGVIGNGEITSSGSVHFDYFQGGSYSYSYRDYGSSYYVYNTTLEFVTVPATVTEICEYAFYQCQGLRKIMGAEGLKTIGAHAFAGASVLTTTQSIESADKYKRYYYNESYSTGAPTATMLRWRSAVALREYLELTAFPVLNTICGYAFLNRKNLFDVRLPSCVAVIEDNAFKACDLNSITVPGKNTAIGTRNESQAGQDALGTKGNPDTVIITVPDSRAMNYGLWYEDYYTLRCGYPVIYDKNALPAETYETTSMLRILKKEISASFSGRIEHYSNSGSVSASNAYEAVLDTEGTLWLKGNGALFPSEVMPGTKFTEIRKVTLSKESSGSGGHRSDYCFAFAGDGRVYVYDPEGSWKDTGIPEGSRGHRWGCSGVTYSNSYSYSSAPGSGYNSDIRIFYLYYINRDGLPYRKEIYRSDVTGSSGSAGSTSYSITAGSIAEPLLFYNPAGTVFESILVVDAKPGTVQDWYYIWDSGSSHTQEYTLYLPDVYAMDTKGVLHRASGETLRQRKYDTTSGESTKTPNYRENELQGKAAFPSHYTWEDSISGIRQVFGVWNDKTGHSYLSALDTNGNLLFYSDVEGSGTGSGNLLGRGKQFTVLTGKNFVSAETLTDGYALLTAADGSLWTYYYRNLYPREPYSQVTQAPRQPQKLPDGIKITAYKETEKSRSDNDGYHNTFYHELALLFSDDRGGFWETKDTLKTSYYPDGSGASSWSASGPRRLLSEEELADAGRLLEKGTYSIGYQFGETLYAIMFEHPGHQFLVWNTKADGTGTSYSPGDFVPIAAPLTIYAQWESVKKTLRYVPNGGAGAMPDEEYAPDVTQVTLSENRYTRKGYLFDGWNTEPLGTGASYGNKASYPLAPGENILYAQWKQIQYTIQTAADEFRVTPVVITKSDTVKYTEPYRIPPGLAAKNITVSYDLREETTGTSRPAVTLTEKNQKAYQAFSGWKLFHNSSSGYDYRRQYLAGTVVQFLAERQGEVLTLFPYWSGDNTSVVLPKPTCTGYRFVAWGLTENETNPERLLSVEDGTETYKPTGNETLYAYWEPEKYPVNLDGRGATAQMQTEVIMTYDKRGPDVLPPEKTGYLFRGYYTGTRGTGTQYFDANGKGTAMWREEKTEVLYAYWVQKPVVLPEEETETPEVVPEEQMLLELMSEKAVVQLYADDKNPLTGPDTEIPPYLVSDCVTDGVLTAAGAIPSTEKVVLCARMGAWMFSGRLERRSGVENVRVYVTASYRTQYENPENEALIISEALTKTIPVTVQKAWSYWELSDGGIYFPDRVIAENDALHSRRVEVPVVWDIDGAVQRPSYQITLYGEVSAHLKWASYDTDGVPKLTITLPEEQYIISDVPGELPDVQEYLTKLCQNAAWRDQTQFTVKSDKVSVAGVSILTDTWETVGHGAAPDREAIEELKDKLEETAAVQTYQSGIPLLATAKNGSYETTASVIYRPGGENAGSGTEKQVWGTEANELSIHTPVVCVPELSTEHEAMYQCAYIPDRCSVLVLDEEGRYSDFTVQIGNTEYHSDKKGYGRRSYAEYLAQKDGKEQNEICFPFVVWMDTENDRDTKNDILLEPGTWYTVGREEQRFYVPVWTREGEYKIRFRSVAVNGAGDEDRTEPVRNAQPEHYVAEAEERIYLTGRLYDFTVYGIAGTSAWNEGNKEALNYSVGPKEPAYSLWDTLPLRIGVHPEYRNVGGLPMGGSLEFRVKGIGSSFAEEAALTIIPQIVLVSEDGYQEADVYYEEETDKGIFLKKWSKEEKAWQLFSDTDSEKDNAYLDKLKAVGAHAEVAEKYEEPIHRALKIWYGTFSLPDRLYVAEKGAAVLEIQQQHGLSFTEDFWVQKGRLMLRFGLELKNRDGEILYYGMLPEESVNNIWQKESVLSYRLDNKGNYYEIQGGEVAVIYPGDSVKSEHSVSGLY